MFIVPGAATADTGYITGTLTYSAGFTVGSTVTFVVSTDYFDQNFAVAGSAVVEANGQSLSYALSRPPGNYSVVAFVGESTESPNTNTPIGVYNHFALVPVVDASTAAGVDFSIAVDSTAPVSAITSIVNGSTVSVLDSISGTAADNVGVSGLQFAAQDLTVGAWWDADGGHWTAVGPLYIEQSFQRGGVPEALDWTLMVSTSSNGSNFGGLSGYLVPGHSYRFYATAGDFVGNFQDPPGTADFTWNGPLGNVAPPAPGNVQGVGLGVSSIAWTWDLVDGATGYLIYVSSSDPAPLASSATNFFVHDGLSPNFIEALCVSAANLVTESPRSCFHDVATLADAPENLRVVFAAETSIGWTWDPAENPPYTVFHLQLSTDGFASWQDIGVGVSTYVVSGDLSPGTTYYARAYALNWNDVPTGYSNTASTRTTTIEVPSPAAVSGAALGVSSIAWTWSVVPSAFFYNVYSSTGGLLASVSGTSYHETGLDENSADFVCVSAVNSQGEGSQRCADLVFTFAAKPGAPFFFDVSFDGFTTFWIQGSNPGPFQVLLSTDGFVLDSRIAVPFSDNLQINTTAFSDLTPDTTYFVRVQFRNGDQIASEPSDISAIRTFKIPPPAPTNLTAAADGPAKLIHLQWQSDQTSFVIRRGVSAEELPYSVSGVTTTYYDDHLSQSGTFYYQVSAKNVDGVEGPRSNVAFAAGDFVAPPAVTDLRLSGQTLSWTAPADDLSGVARFLLYTSQTNSFAGASSAAISALPPGSTVSFSVELSSGHASFFAEATQDNAGNISDLSNIVVFDPVAPVVAFVSLTDGRSLSRPVTVSAQAADNVAVASVAFSVDGVLASSAAAASASFFWDTRPLSDDIHTLTVAAFDSSGNQASVDRGVTVTYAPPPAPVITSPYSGFTTKVATVNVSGLADAAPGVGVVVLADGIDLDTAAVVNGHWQALPETLPYEGSLSLTAIAFESRGFSQQSSPVVVEFSGHAPQAPEFVQASELAGGQARIAWSAPASGTPPSFYRVYRSTDDAQAGAVVGAHVAALAFTDAPASDDLYFYVVSAVDGVGNEGPLSESAYAVVDRVAPSAAVLISTAQPVGPGVYNPLFQISEMLSEAPVFTFTPPGRQPEALSLAAVTATLWRSTITVTSELGRGTGQFAFQGTDLAGNVGTSVSSAAFFFDALAPVGTVTMSKPSPVGAGALGFTLALDEPAASTPTLTLSPQGLSAPLSFDGNVWSGSVTITSSSGDGQAFLVYSATDALGNAGTALSGGVSSFVIDTIAPGPPPFVGAQSLPAARIRVFWSKPFGENPSLYRVYRDDALLASVAPAGDGSGTYTDTAPEGLHQYQVSSLDQAGNESAPTDPTALARSVPPSAPVDVAAGFNQFDQVQVSWQEGSTDTARFALYRTTYAVTGSSGAFSLSQNAVSPFVDPVAVDGIYHYVVTAFDSVGNESVVSSEAVVTVDNGHPFVAIYGVTDGFLYNADVAPTFVVEDLILDTASVHALLDGQDFASGTTVSAPGAHTLTVSAANTAGHVATASVSFSIDKQAPLIVFSVVEGAALTSTSPVSVQITVSDLNPGTSSFFLYNQLFATTAPFVTGGLISLNGRYTLSASATDRAGNTGTAALSFTLETAPLAPLGLTVTVGDSARLSWRSPEPDVTGYRVYRDGSRISAGLFTDTLFQDAGFTPAGHLYEVSAVDAQGVEGPRARASVPAASLTFQAPALTRGFFDALHPIVQNNSTSTLAVGPALLALTDASGQPVAAATASAVSIAAGQAGTLEGVLAVPVSLSTASSVHVSVSLPTDVGAAVFLAGDFALRAQEPALPLIEAFPGALVQGTLSPVQIRLYNRGTAPMDVVTAQIVNSTYAAVDDVSVQLLSSQGTLFASGGLIQAGNGASSAFRNGRQVFFVTIPAGQSFLFDPVRVLVPNTAAASLSVAAVVSTLTYSLPFAALPGTRGFSTVAAQATVARVPYTATIFPDRFFYDQGSSVTFSGQTLDTESGFPVPNSSVLIHVVSNGFDRAVSAATDSSGTYRAAFFPLPNEAGVYGLSASHPAVVTRTSQSSFTIVGFQLQYSNYTATLAQNSTFKFTASLTNTGASAISGLTASAASVSGSSVTLSVDSPPAALEAGASANLGLTLSALPQSTSSVFVLTVGESHGYQRTMPVNATVVPAEVIPAVTPQQFNIGLVGGDTRVFSVKLENKGFDTWRSVSLTNPALSWVTLQGAQNLGDIPPGGNANVTLTFAPPQSLPNQTYSPNPLLQITSLNVAPVPIVAAVAVTSARKGDVLVAIINADKPKDPISGNGVPITGAKATLTSLDVAGLNFTVSGDANGVAAFSQVPSGNYVWRAEAQGFQTVSGTALIEPGLVNKIQAVLPTATVSYQWSVTPTTIIDKYNITLDLKFQTDVPAPVIIVDPPIVELNLEVGQTAYAQYTVTNKGLVSAFNLNVAPANSDPGMRLEAGITSVPELKPGQSVIVPVKATLLHASCAHADDMGQSCEYGCAFGALVRAGIQAVRFIIYVLGSGDPSCAPPPTIRPGGQPQQGNASGLSGVPQDVVSLAAVNANTAPTCGDPNKKDPGWLQNPDCGGASPLDGSHNQPTMAPLGFSGSGPSPTYAPPYNSATPTGASAPSQAPGSSAPGWAPPAPVIQTNADGTFTKTEPDGSKQLFVPLGPLDQPLNGSGPQFAQPVQVFQALTFSQDHFTQTDKDGTVTLLQKFAGGNYLPVSVEDRNGNRIDYDRERVTITRDLPLTCGSSGGGSLSCTGGGQVTVTDSDNSSGKLLSIRDNFGRSISFSYNASSQVVSAADSTGRSTSYGYDAFGNKTSETDVNGDTTHYAYDSNHRMTQITYPNGGVMTLTYDGQGRVIHESDDGGNNARTYVYDSTRTTVTDALDHATEYDWTEVQGRRNFTRIVDANGGVTSFAYDSSFNMTSRTDPLGRVTKLKYGDNGNVTAITDPAGHATQVTYEPDFNQPTNVVDANGNRTSLFYDAKGNLIQAQDAVGNSTVISYDRRGHVTGVKDALGDDSALTYDAKGAVAGVTDPLGRAISMTRDSLSRVTQFFDPASKKTEISYNAAGDVLQIKDPLSHQTNYAYLTGRLGKVPLSVTDANGHATTFAYDALGRFNSLTDAKGKTASMTYDVLNKPTSITARDGTSFSLTYDDLNRVTKMTAPEGDVNLSYDAVGHMLAAGKYNATSLAMSYDTLDRVTQVVQTLPNGYSAALGYTFDAKGNRTRMTTPWGSFIYTYDSINRVTSITNPFGQTFAFTYDALSGLTMLSYPNGMAASYAYDAAGQITQIVHQKTGNQTAIAFSNYTYDAVGNVTGIADVGGNHVFTYDQLDQLTGASHAGTSILSIKGETFAYDPVGNRTSDAARTDYVYDQANRLQSDSSFTYTSDYNGNNTSRTSGGQTRTYRYDSSSRIVEVDGPGGAVIATYKYDPAGKRVEKNVGGAIQRFIYDEGGLLAVLDGSNNLVALMTEVGIGAPLAMRKGGQDYFFHMDALGSVNALTDSSGVVVETYEYQAFGRAMVKDAQGGLHDQSTVGNPFLYAGTFYDPETGLNHAGNRDQDPDTGRFLQEDPIPSINQFAYAENSPLNFADPQGLSALGDIGTGCGAGFTSGLSMGYSAGYGSKSDPCTTASKYAYGICKIAGFVAINYAFGAAFEWGVAKVIGAFGRGAVESALKSDLAAAVAQFKEKGFTQAQQAALENNTNLAAAFKGERIDQFFREAVANNPIYAKNGIQLTPRGKFGPDVFDAANKRWWDVTTPRQWAKHVNKYKKLFGNGTHLSY